MDWGQLFQIIFIVGCCLPMLIIGGFMLWLLARGKAMLDSFTQADSDALFARYQSAQAAQSASDPAVALQPIIRRQALEAGLVGAVTSLGGFITLPIALPIDLLLSARNQANLVAVIARAYGREGDIGSKAANYLILTGSSQASQFTVRLLLRLFGKWAAKLIPFFGAIIGFAINYGITRSIGHASLLYYKRLAQTR